MCAAQGARAGMHCQGPDARQPALWELEQGQVYFQVQGEVICGASKHTEYCPGPY